MAIFELDWSLGPLLLSALAPFLVPVAGMAGGGGPSADTGGATSGNEDHDLVKRVLEGDGTAYRGLVERYQGRIYNVCYGMVRNREDARDLAQEAFVKAYKNLHRFRLESSFYTWICRIAMNVSIDHLRKQKVRRAEQFDDGIWIIDIVVGI